MLGAVNLRLPMVLFDTNLAGYLIDPDFQGGSLQDCADHFLHRHAEEVTETEQAPSISEWMTNAPNVTERWCVMLPL